MGLLDRSGEILRSYAGRIVLIEQENIGIEQVRNVGIKKAGGELVALLDADDRFLPGHLRAMQEFEKKHPDAVGFYGEYWLIDPQGKKLRIQKSPPNANFENLVMGNYIVHSSVMIRPSFFDRGERYHIEALPGTGNCGFAPWNMVRLYIIPGLELNIGNTLRARFIIIKSGLKNGLSKSWNGFLPGTRSLIKKSRTRLMPRPIMTA